MNLGEYFVELGVTPEASSINGFCERFLIRLPILIEKPRHPQ
jgi:hypothetical protein